MYGVFIGELATSIRNRTIFPKMPENLSLEDGYQIQRELIRVLVDSSTAGLKAGLTDRGPQRAFGVKHPLIGSLYVLGRLENGTTIAHEYGVKLECEIGIVIDGTGRPRAAAPVVELPRMAWADSQDAKGVNLAACNVAADRYIVGEQHPFKRDYSEYSVSMSRDGESVCCAPLTDALGGPQKGLAWLLEEASTRSVLLADGMLLLTGACGGLHNAAPGKYVADYGSLGMIRFTIN